MTSNKTDFFDKECHQRYGSHTCILIQCDDDIYEFRLLDNLSTATTITKRTFVDLIPQMLSQNYTVVIVENTLGIGKEVRAVHLPKQTQLTTPPIFS